MCRKGITVRKKVNRMYYHKDVDSILHLNKHSHPEGCKPKKLRMEEFEL